MSFHQTSSSHSPPMIPRLKTIYPITPHVPPNPKHPTPVFHPTPLSPLVASNASPPNPIPKYPHVSTSTCLLFSSNLQLRSFHSISSRPHILATSPTARTPVPITAPTPVERRIVLRNGGGSERRRRIR
ncbi:hypothetical protein ABVK25_004143 [Lepraria finkii]|uniref:Uncharacterized protein n=1 Tax=Lepraria finkii TaxID=1340010 RepID=A0ABR4BCF5_9LECA